MKKQFDVVAYGTMVAGGAVGAAAGGPIGALFGAAVGGWAGEGVSKAASNIKTIVQMNRTKQIESAGE